jgi:hypothetical protein
MWYHCSVADSEQLSRYLVELEQKAVRFSRLLSICESVFGPPRIRGSHFIFKTPWRGDPRINVQKVKGGMSKPYQVKQVIAAIERLLQSSMEEP